MRLLTIYSCLTRSMILGKLKTLRSPASLYVHGHKAGGTNPSLVEAMHFGKPVLAFDCSFNRTTTENKALYFSDGDALQQLINTLTRNRQSKSAGICWRSRSAATPGISWHASISPCWRTADSSSSFWPYEVSNTRRMRMKINIKSLLAIVLVSRSPRIRRHWSNFCGNPESGISQLYRERLQSGRGNQSVCARHCDDGFSRKLPFEY